MYPMGVYAAWGPARISALDRGSQGLGGVSRLSPRVGPVGRLDSGSKRKSMRIRALISIVITAGWVLPAGVLACPAHSAAANAHVHAAPPDGHEHSHAASEPGPGGHDHAARPESRTGEPGAPTHAPTCCSDDARIPAVAASMLDGKPRPKSISLSLPSPLLDAPRAEVLPSASRFQLRQPAPLPYARTRRPLLI